MMIFIQARMGGFSFFMKARKRLIVMHEGREYGGR